MERTPESNDVTRVDTEADAEILGARALGPGTAIGRYVILERIGAGGMGFVYAAYDPDLDRKVALKLLRGGDRDDGGQTRGARRLLREAQAMARLRHPNVVTVHDVGTYADQIFFAMEFLDGRTIKAWLAEESPDWRRVLEVYVAAGRGLAAAHGMELTHRDFKPENVMIDGEGRVLVLDFGLARADRGAEPGGEDTLVAASPSAASSIPGGGDTLDDLTRTGAALGTPAYMAPEQHLGQIADVRADQFSFCVALYEGLYAQRPFPGTTHASLAFNVTSGNVAPPPRGSPVPTEVGQALVRGMSVEPRDRWPSMDALLEVLAAAGAGGRSRGWPWVAGVGGLAAILLIGFAGADATTSPCASAGARADEVWNDARRGELERAFAGIGLEFAARTWTTVDGMVDAYVTQWVEQREQACEDTRVHHAMSGEVMDLRNACLDRALAEVDARLSLLSDPDADMAQRAVESISELPSLDACADVAALRAAVAPPRDPAAAERVEQVRARLADARAHELGGRYAEGMEIATAAAADATAIEYCPLEAEAQLQVGRLRRELGEYEVAEGALEDAYFFGTRCRHESVTVDAANLLVRLVGARLQRFDEGERWGRYVLSSLERDGARGTAMHARLLLNLADLDSQRGDQQRALERAEQALSIAQTRLEAGNPQLFTAQQRVGLALAHMGRTDDALASYELALERGIGLFGADHPRLAGVLHAMANVYADKGEYEPAIHKFNEALAMREAALGREHPDVASTRNDLGTVYFHMGRFDEALVEQERALEIRHKAFGPDHSSVGGTWNNLGNLYQEMADPDRALDAYRRALAVFETSVGKQHRYTAAALNNIGILLDEKSRYEEAIEHYERALAIKRVALGVDHESNGATLQNIAAAYEMMGRFDDALSYYRDAHDVTRAALGSEHPALAYPLVGLGSTYLNLGRPAQALEPLEHAMRIREATQVPEKEMAITQFHLARALWDLPDQRARARELLATAHATLTRLGEPAHGFLDQLDGWVRSRRIRL